LVPTREGVCCDDFRPDGFSVNQGNVRQNIRSKRQRLRCFIKNDFNFAGIRYAKFLQRGTNAPCQVRPRLGQQVSRKIVVVEKPIRAAALVFRKKLERRIEQICQKAFTTLNPLSHVAHCS
jgi:hypothetical protein